MSDLNEFDEPTFEIWHPICTKHNTRTRCRMDLTRLAFYQLKKGDPDCITAILTSLGIPYLEIISWSIDRYCSPYYANPVTPKRWEDKLPITWRMAIEIENLETPPRYLTQGPFETTAYDSTFVDIPDSWSRGREHCIIIADSTEAPSSSLIASLPGEIEVLDYTTPGKPLFQIRTDLGILELPTGMREVDLTLSIFRSQGLWTNWQESLHGRL